jgi:hypothetical protein
MSVALRQSIPTLVLMTAIAAMLVGAIPNGSPISLAIPAVGHSASELSAAQVSAARASLAAGQGPAGAPVPATSSVPTTGTLGTPWTTLNNLSQPSARATPAMAYLPSAGYVVYFGGGWNLGASGNDTWTYAGGVWTNLTAGLAVAPIARENGLMTYDAADGYLLLFGGYTDVNSTGGQVPSYTLNDTWAFAGGSWTNLTSSVAPPPLFGASMTYDYGDGYVLLFGGEVFGPSTPMNDTWTFQAGTWTNITATAGAAPVGRDYAAMADDPADGYVVLYGGWGGTSNSSTTILSDTWDFSHGVWAALSPSTSPPPLRGAMMAYDGATGSLILFGGATWGFTGPFSPLSQTWSFSGGAWTNLTLSASNSPPARFLGGLTNLSAGTLVMSDGCVAQGCAQYDTMSDTWLYNASGPSGRPWIEVGGVTSPSARATEALAYDPVDHYVVYFGGGWGGGESGNDTWTYANGSWTNISATLTNHPGWRESPLMVWDASDGYLLLFGGYTDGGSSGAYSYTLNDTWTFLGGVWTNITTSHAPPPVFVGQMAYDYNDGYVVLFGGNVLFGAPLQDTWTFHAGAWTDISATAGTPPPPRDFASMVDDPAAGYVLLFGGYDISTGTVYNDTWAFSNGTWTQLNPAVSPVPLRGAMVAFEAVGGYVLLFGGTTYSGPSWPFGLEAQTWAFANGTWTNLTPYITAEPPARFSGGMTNLSDSGQLLMASGSLGQGSFQYEDLSDTWLYSWANINGTVSLLTRPTGPNSTASFLVHAVGGNFQYNYQYSGLPAGCASADLAAFSCVPTVGGNYVVDVLVTDTAGASVQLEMNLSIPQTPLSTSLALSASEVDLGQPVVLTIAAAGGTGAPWSYAYLGLPAGCLSQDLAQLSCSPTRSGNFVITGTATDSQGGTITAAARLLVNPHVAVAGTISTMTIDLSQAVTVNAAATDGAPGYTYTWSGLPEGCPSSSAAQIVCTPTQLGTSTISVSATDALQQSAVSIPVELTVNPWPAVSTTVEPVAASSPLTVTLVATPSGGTAPYQVAWVFGDGTTATGTTVSHAYDAGGTYTARVWVNDSVGGSTSSPVTVTVAPLVTHPIAPGGPAPPTWYDTMDGQLVLGLLLSVVAAAIVVGWAGVRRRQLRRGDELVRSLDPEWTAGPKNP